MGNRPVEKVYLSKDTVDEIRKTFSLRKLAKAVGVGDRTIRYWLEKYQMPTYLWNRIEEVMHPKTRKIWMRLGVSVPVTEEELYELMKESEKGNLDAYGRYGFEDVDLFEDQARAFLRRAEADGESYIPGVCFDVHEYWYKQQKEQRGE